MLAAGAELRGLTPPPDRSPETRGLVALTALALVVGAASGAVGAAFRVSLDRADGLRNALIAAEHAHGYTGLALVVILCAAAALIAAWLVRRFSRYASGSGVPHVEAVLEGLLPPAPYVLAPVKFIGGVLAIGSGLALGREGPSVQLGSTIAIFVGRLFRLPWDDCRTLCAAGAGAGLATAFNAPIAGAIFVLEELVQRFEPRMAVAGLAASAAAIGVARTLLGDSPDFLVSALPAAPGSAMPLFFLLGAFAGLLGVLYNRAIVATSATLERLPLPVEARAGLIGAGVGALAWFAPWLVGGGDSITQSVLAGSETVQVAAFAFLVRFALGALSYAAATPGGLFAPMLTLGAQAGLMFGALCHWIWPGLDTPLESFALVGMAAFFTGVVRAPLTGMVLASELTGNETLFHAMLGACAIAMLVPMLMRNEPIYDVLKDALMEREQRRMAAAIDAGQRREIERS